MRFENVNILIINKGFVKVIWNGIWFSEIVFVVYKRWEIKGMS